jgi:hypothetical protein
MLAMYAEIQVSNIGDVVLQIDHIVAVLGLLRGASLVGTVDVVHVRQSGVVFDVRIHVERVAALGGVDVVDQQEGLLVVGDGLRVVAIFAIVFHIELVILLFRVFHIKHVVTEQAKLHRLL